MHDLKHTLGSFEQDPEGRGLSARRDYIDLLSLLYFFVRLASTKGSMAVEPHIEKPEESAALQQVPEDPAPTITPAR